MRKKWTYVAIVSMMLGVAPVFTGCVDTDEPAGIEQLRGAKAALLNAKAEVEKAKVELVAAQAEHERQQAAIAEANADYRKAEAEYYRAKTEKEKLIWAEELKEKQAAVEAAIAASKAAQAESELALINMQKAIAIAKASLTQKEYESLWLYQLNINEATSRLNWAKLEYDEATKELTDAMSSYDDVMDDHEEKSRLEHEVEVAKYRLALAEEARNDAQNWAENMPEEIEAWKTRYAELEQKEADLKTEEKELQVKQAEWEADSKEAVAYREAEAAWKIAKGKEVTLEAYSYDADLSVLNIYKSQTIKGSEVTGSYEGSDGYYAEPASPDDNWIDESSSIGSYITNLEGNIQFFEGLKLDKNGEAWNDIRVNQAKADVTAKTTEFTNASKPWQNAIDGFNDGVTAKPEVLTEAIAVSDALKAYNTAVENYTAAVADEAVKLVAAQKVLTADELNNLDATIKACEDIMEDGNSTNNEVAAATAKYNAANEYKTALETREAADNALNGYDNKGTWVKGAYEVAQDKFNAYQAEYSIDYSQWDAVQTAYSNGKTVTAEQISKVIAVTCDQIENVIASRSYDLFGSEFGTRLVAVTGDELAAAIQKELSNYPDYYYVVPTSEFVHWERYAISISDVTEAHIKYFLLGGFDLMDENFNFIRTVDYKTIGALEQAKSNVTRGEAFAKGNATAVDAAVKYLTEVLDKATGEKGILTLNNAEIDALEAKMDEAEAAKDAAFEATGLYEQIQKNIAAQGTYNALITNLKDLIDHCLGDFLEGSNVTPDNTPDWDALQKQLDLQYRLAQDNVDRMQNLLTRAEKNLANYGTEEIDRVTQANERLAAADEELKAANAELETAVQALQDIISTILASVQ